MLDFETVNRELEKVRPYLVSDGGDVSLVEITEKNVVKVKILGSCRNCPLLPMTLRAGIERALMEALPEIKRVEAVNL